MNDDDTVTLPALTYHELVRDAGAWRLLNQSPHVAALLDEWITWDHRRRLRESSWEISAMRNRWDHVSYAQLERRRSEYAQPPRSAAEIRRQARVSWAEVEQKIERAAEGDRAGNTERLGPGDGGGAVGHQRCAVPRQGNAQRPAAHR